MERPPIASAKEFSKQFTKASALPGTAGSLLIVAYFVAVLDLGTDGWRALGGCVGVMTVVMTAVSLWMQRRTERDVVHALERIAEGTPTRDDLKRAYAAARRLPTQATRTQIASYLVSGVLVPTWMQVAIPDISGFTLAVLALGSVTGGAACVPFCAWAAQRFVAPTRDYFAGLLTTDERSADPAPSSLAFKLAFPFVTASAATAAFLALLGFSVAVAMIESQDLRHKQAFLEGARKAYATNPATLRHLQRAAEERAVAERVFVIDLAAPAGARESDALTPREVAWVRGGTAGHTSAGIDSSSSFAWVPVDGGRALVASSPMRGLVGDLGTTLAVVALVIAGTMGLSLAVALIAASDTRRVGERLRVQALRVGSGDFTAREIIESEDELGAVAHAFAKMTETLGETLKRVISTAGRMEEAAGQLARIGTAVREVTDAQVKGIERANSSVSLVSRQASSITASAQELIGGVEEASSSVLELGAASEELNQTTIALGTQIEAVGASIDQMVRSVAKAGEASEALNVTVVDTNSSVAEMARSMQSVDAHAWETARLSTRVVELADGGRDRVQETMRGMEVIRDATDSANRTIAGLADRMHEIGAIVDVIDEIADETNLLALNAAIIAAQAGDQGRAFSVVADEIKDLADRVLSNTKEIGGLIRSVQDESASAADAIRSGAERVQSGVDLSAQAGVALEEITAAARHAGERIQEIVQAMREQTRAATHVEQLSQGVTERVDEIRTSVKEQSRGNEVVMRGSLVMRDVAQQTQRTTEEQARGAMRIRDSIESVREAVDRIHASLQQQNESCRSAVSALADVGERTRSNDEATHALGGAASALQQLAEALREDVRNFRVA
jgi:methyl-accepting chemotaxis protein